jgi:hypothetical protein
METLFDAPTYESVLWCLGRAAIVAVIGVFLVYVLIILWDHHVECERQKLRAQRHDEVQEYFEELRAKEALRKGLERLKEIE